MHQLLRTHFKEMYYRVVLLHLKVIGGITMYACDLHYVVFEKYVRNVSEAEGLTQQEDQTGQSKEKV